MKLSTAIKSSINKSVLCWLATANKAGIPNVSPKEVFDCFNDESIIIANIASPQSVSNIQENDNVCLSFIDILVQKGFQLKGNATIIEKSHTQFDAMSDKLLRITQGQFPFSNIIEITVRAAKPIIAPRYLLYPETTEVEQIERAKKSYGF